MTSLFDTKEEKIAAKARRVALCRDSGVPCHEWSPATLTTYVNAMAVLYKKTRPPHGIVVRARAQFPKFVRFLDAASSSHKQKKCREPQVRVLCDADILRLCSQTNWDTWYEAQRMNILILSYNLGGRRESLVELRLGNFHVDDTDKDAPTLTAKFGKMKNLPGGDGKQKHEQLLLPPSTPEICPVARTFARWTCFLQKSRILDFSWGETHSTVTRRRRRPLNPLSSVPWHGPERFWAA